MSVFQCNCIVSIIFAITGADLHRAKRNFTHSAVLQKSALSLQTCQILNNAGKR